MKYLLAIALALVCAAPAVASDLPVTLVNPPGGVHVSQCNIVDELGYLSDEEQYAVSATIDDLHAMNIQLEVTYVYGDGRAYSRLIPLAYRNDMTAHINVPKMQTPVVGARCAVAFATTDNQQYVAPWVPLDWTRWMALPDIPTPGK